ncbi:Aste57867_11510 [Aphanomyces stellatus]|uniref:Aste57867_11510 protein n=1 Tax=Aphanomyces stellatus TaxID=120398 RepID=A0A485KT66_9STRA|nr:hypothetical protein As57867_011467 [Aphanomyces stellatus]VFT88371.1 Aste57867_11510 [Aphanomyces stellatus]
MAAGGAAAAFATLAYCSSANSPIPTQPKNYVTIDASECNPGHGPVHRVGTFPTPSAVSMLHVLQTAVELNGGGRFLGHRPIDADGNALEFVWQSYDQVYQRIQRLAAGLMHKKLVELTADEERPLCLYLKNCPEWVIAHYAVMYCGGFSVPLYDTLGAGSSEFILNQTLAPTVVCRATELATLLALKPSTPTLQHVVLLDLHVVSPEQANAAAALGLELHGMDALEAIGSHYPMIPVMPQGSGIYSLLYTSGTTGQPKGVPISQENLTCAYQGLRERAWGMDTFNGTESAVHLSYMPLAHLYEHLAHAIVLHAHGSIGFYQGNTLQLIDDLALLRPTFFITVPRLLHRIYDKVVGGAKTTGGFKAWLFDFAVQTKLAHLKQDGVRHHRVLDSLVFSKILRRLGLDRCKFVVSASAPLADDVMNFFRIVFTCPFLEAYGQSESVGGGTTTHVADTVAGTVGPPLITTEIKLVSVPEMGYHVSDTQHGSDDEIFVPPMAVRGRGEICFRGPCVFSGYYKAPEKTANVMDADGWLHSGDIGVWTLDGRLKIVDRKSNIFKLSQGEFVSPEKIENVLALSPLVNQAFVHGQSTRSHLVAVVVPDEEALMAVAESLGVSGSWAQVCANKPVVAAVLAELIAWSKASKLCGFETVRAIKLHPMPFSVENGLLTPTFKLKRADAKTILKPALDDLYSPVLALAA